MSKFIFKSYKFDAETSLASFNYSFEEGLEFTETVSFKKEAEPNQELLDKSLFLAFILIGTSYYKTFPSRDVEIDAPIDEWQAKFFNNVYQEGLGQYAFENELRREDLAHSKVSTPIVNKPTGYEGQGVLALQSGGKDSLLTASLLSEKGAEFTSWYVSSSEHYPEVIEGLGNDLAISIRTIDKENLQKAIAQGARNGHVPITYILQSLAVTQAILLGKKTVLTSIAHEGEEPHSQIGDLSITHQWSKTWDAEKLFAEYVSRYISPDIEVGSPLRQYSELRVAEMFVEHSWKKYGHVFSSCNIANYQQGNDNTKLAWCGNCPKCANSYLLFAPFLEADELKGIFGGQDLFSEPSLEFTFKGLLGIDGIMKPFECVGEIDELRMAYRMAIKKGGYEPLPFTVPESNFDYMQSYPAQSWAEKMLQ